MCLAYEAECLALQRGYVPSIGDTGVHSDYVQSAWWLGHLESSVWVVSLCIPLVYGGRHI